MTTGTVLRITQSTIALADTGGKRTMVTVPSGSIVTVLPPLAEDEKFISVLWGDRPVEMFAIDAFTRGTKIGSRAAAAA